MPASGETWKQFKLLKPLGRGGMGEVYLAEDNSLDRKVALKFLPEPLQQDETARERLLREARSAASLDHPYICKIYEVGEVDGTAFIAMEYIEGVTAQEKLRQGPLSITELVNVAIEIGEAIEAAHEKQIVHRDLKAANIMMTPDGHVKVMDFGLAKEVAMAGQESKLETLSAKLSEGGTTPGTVVYMSPEQVRGEPLDNRSDIFSLGVLLYELATGVVPFQGATSGLTYDAILNRGASPPSKVNREVPDELEQIIQKALEKDRENRYQNVKEVIVDLRRLRRDSGSGAPPFEEAPAAASTTAGAATTPKRGAAGWIAAAAILAIAVIGWAVLGGDATDGGGPAITSLAVLPFENPRNDPDVDYLGDGIAESLINRLSELPQLSVKARSTAFRYRGPEVDPQVVGNELDVGAVLMGRVVQQGDTLNVQAELVDTAKGTQIWGQQYERDLGDLLTVQNDLATEISRALRLTLTGEEESALAAGGTTDSRAYQSYLRGRFLLAKRSNEDIKKSIRFFEEALDQDPDYALARAGLADAYFLLGGQFYGAEEEFPPAESIERARSLVREALELNADLAEPRATLAFIRFAYDWDWDGAEQEFRAALELDPTYAQAHQWYATYLAFLGRYDEAIEEAAEAVRLEPASGLFNRTLASMYFLVGRYDDAIAQLEKTLELDPDFPLVRQWLVDVHWVRGDEETAVAIAEDLDPDVARVYRLAADDQMEEARAALASLPPETMEGRGITMHLLVGEEGEFFDALEARVQSRDTPLLPVLTSPLLNPLRSDPRTLALLERMGLPP